MRPFGVEAVAVATVLAGALAGRAHRRRSLTPGGCVAAFCVGFLMVASGWRGLNLFVFYLFAMAATKHRHDVKATMDGALQRPAPSAGTASATTTKAAAMPVRGAGQVLACSLIAAVLSVVHAAACGAERPIDYGGSPLASALTCGVVAHHAACLADTLASELGILSVRRLPVLITQPWRAVPPGTNGGVTVAGFCWSALGGAAIGMSTVLLDWAAGTTAPAGGAPSAPAMVVLFAAVCGLVGSALDSLLGATVQQTYYDVDARLVYQADDAHRPAGARLVVETAANVLTNEQVNVVSVALTTVLGGWVLGPLFFA